MKLTTKQLQCLKTIYLYSDAHAVLIFEKRDQQAGRVEWAEIIEDTGVRCMFKGRLIFSSFYDFTNFGLARIVLGAERIEAAKNQGSPRTKELGIQVDHCEIRTKEGTIDLYDMPNLISGRFTYQPEIEEEFNLDLYSWGLTNVAKIHRKEGA